MRYPDAIGDPRPEAGSYKIIQATVFRVKNHALPHAVAMEHFSRLASDG